MKTDPKQDRCDKIMQILVAPVIYLVTQSARVMKLPLQNLIEVVSLRVLDAESLYCLVVSLSHVVSDVLVVVLSCTCVDVDYAWWDLASVRVLEVCEVKWRYVTV